MPYVIIPPEIHLSVMTLLVKSIVSCQILDIILHCYLSQVRTSRSGGMFIQTNDWPCTLSSTPPVQESLSLFCLYNNVLPPDLTHPAPLEAAARFCTDHVHTAAVPLGRCSTAGAGFADDPDGDGAGVGSGPLSPGRPRVGRV